MDFKMKRNTWQCAREIRIYPRIFDDWFFPGTTEMRIHSLWFCKVDLSWHFHKWNKLFMGTTQCSLASYYEELNRLQYQVLNKINYPCKDVTVSSFCFSPILKWRLHQVAWSIIHWFTPGIILWKEAHTAITFYIRIFVENQSRILTILVNMQPHKDSRLFSP